MDSKREPTMHGDICICKGSIFVVSSSVGIVGVQFWYDGMLDFFLVC
jgi:hypothetical protein